MRLNGNTKPSDQPSLSLDEVLDHLDHHKRQAGPFWRHVAKLVWPIAQQIRFCGPFASLCGCKGLLTVYLCSTLEAAQRCQKWVADHSVGRTWLDAGTHAVADLRVYMSLGFVRVEKRRQSLVPVAVPPPPMPLPPGAAQRMWEEMRAYVHGEQEKFLRHYAGGIRDKKTLRHLGINLPTAMWSRFLRDVKASLDRSVALWRDQQP